ncbi:lysosomal protective protein isoform X2 [Aplysia californica]|nr:lysosomal protective protein isoform X2 [Aplysia californica]XP_005108566.2 lysosomal protective protein isoform X2 [Aplysia californica]
MLSLCCVLAVLVVQAYAAPEEDLVTSLPGLGWKPNFKQYSGYLDAARSRHLHYWFVESSSNPKTDPVVLWMNGGPGCSSLHGMLTEHGPFRIQDDGKTLGPNPFAWNQVANMIYLEAPAGVGFSYSDDGNYTTDDDEVAMNNHLALKAFFTKFPEYKSHDFYISGESYGGIYVPTLASVVLDDPAINLKGFVVGNGLSDDDLNDNSIVYFAYYHGLIGESDWKFLLSYCCPGASSASVCDFAAGSRKSQQCLEKLSAVQQLVWASGLNVYNLYGECAGGALDRRFYYDKKADRFVTNQYLYPFNSMLKTDMSVMTMLKLASAKNVGVSPPCVNETSAKIYLNTPAVRTALHIAAKALTWDVCSGPVGAGYHRLYTTMRPQYEKALSRKMRILVYNGDVDMACNFLGDEWFVDQLDAKNPQQRKSWYYEAADGTKQVAGFYKAFDQITFVTVRGAGHMVPSDKPRPALKMFLSFIQRQPF